MWYLSRTPSNPKTDDDFNFSLPNSIFPVSDSGLFQGICMIEVPNNLHHEKSNEEEQGACPFSSSFPKWEWFAYLSSPTQFRSMAVPRNPSLFTVQVIKVLPQHLLCAKLLVRGQKPYATLCSYSCSENSLDDVPKMNCADRNLFGAACAILDGWLYVAGGYTNSSPETVPSSHLDSVERLNLKTWQWEALPNMPNPRAFAYGIAHKGKFFVVGGGSNAALKHSADIYTPSNNSWRSLKSFVPQEADGFTATSLDNLLLILTWSDRLGVKLWLCNVLAGRRLPDVCETRLISYLPNQIVERPRLKALGARMVPVGGKEVWILVGENERILQVDRSCAWPVFPSPLYKPNEGHKAVSKGYIHAFSFHGVRISWRQIPLYSL